LLTMSSPIPTTLNFKEKNGKKTSKHTSTSRKSSTKNTLKLSNTKLKISMSPTLTERLLSPRTTQTKSSKTMPMLLPMTPQTIFILRICGLDTKTLLLLTKLLSKLPLKHNGHKNSTLLKLPLETSKTHLNTNHTF